MEEVIPPEFDRLDECVDAALGARLVKRISSCVTSIDEVPEDEAEEGGLIT